MKKLLSLMSVFILTFALAGCFGGDKSGEMMDEDSNMEEASGEGMTKLDKTLEVTTEDGASYEVTLNHLYDAWMYPETAPARANELREGTKLLAVNLTVENTSDAEVMVKARDFGLWGGDTSYAHWIAFAGETGFDEFEAEVTLAPGDEYTGTVLFTVDETMAAADFEFDVYRSNVGRGDDMELTLGDAM